MVGKQEGEIRMADLGTYNIWGDGKNLWRELGQNEGIGALG